MASQRTLTLDTEWLLVSMEDPTPPLDTGGGWGLKTGLIEGPIGSLRVGSMNSSKDAEIGPKARARFLSPAQRSDLSIHFQHGYSQKAYKAQEPRR